MSKFHEPKQVIFICTGDKCGKKGGKDCYKTLKSYRKLSGRKDEFEIVKVDCFDRCKFAPVLSIQPDNIWMKEYAVNEVLRFLERKTEY